MDLVLPLLLRLERLLQRLPVEGVRAPVSSVCVCVCVCCVCVYTLSLSLSHTHTHTCPQGGLPWQRSWVSLVWERRASAPPFAWPGPSSWSFQTKGSGLCDRPSASQMPCALCPQCVCVCVCVACLCVYSLSPHFRVQDLDLCP